MLGSLRRVFRPRLSVFVEREGQSLFAPEELVCSRGCGLEELVGRFKTPGSVVTMLKSSMAPTQELVDSKTRGVFRKYVITSPVAKVQTTALVER